MNNEIDMENSASTRTSGTHIEFDENSGRTLSHPGPWYEVLKERKSQKTADENRIKGDSKANSAQNLNGETSGLTNPKMQPTNNQLQQQRRGDGRSRGDNNTPPRKRMLPPLPEDEYKVVYRPRTGLKLSAWSDKSLTQGIATAGGFPFKDFYSNVTIQTQWAQNLIMARVVHGIEAGTTEEELKELISVNGYSILHARMLGKSSSALLTFEGPHVPFYVKAGSMFTRCRPHRRSVQYCRACGNVGHRQDVCPNPDTNRCNRCGAENPQDNHECQPKCKLCYQPHETASKECQKRLKPSPPPLHVRERSKSQSKQAAWTGVANDRPSEQHEQTPLPQDRVMSWPQLGSHSLNAPDPFPPLPVKQQDSSNAHFEQTIDTLKKQNAELIWRLENNEKKAKSREHALEQKLQQFIEQMQKQQQQVPQTPPRAPTPLPEDLEQKMEYRMNKLDERIDQKIDQTMSQMTEAVEHKMNKMMETVNKVFENVNPTIIQMSTTLNAKIDRMGETFNAQMSKMGDELNKRISDLEKEREQARKKPKTDTLRRLGYAIEDESRSKQRITLQLRDKITVASIPRNMHPEHNKERRMARVRALRKTYERDDDRVRYTDAAKYKGKKAHAVSVVNNKGEEIAAASVRTSDTDSAEETAISLAATTGKELLTVITDSQAACRNYQLGRISRLALETLARIKDPPEIDIVWTPGHETLAGNLAAHAAAREHSLRATSLSDRAPADTDEGVPKRYTDILAHYRLGRRTYPPPHPTISREDAQWQDQLTSSKPEDQSQLVNRARLAARDHGILD
ncbi:hypothetical protein HPB47_011690 [Ixodes persulcatus]|uniref:Uncharacterized protein n=1 Tax=Ixodes persulcatus TaxID=34615 RepID=A0AC60NVM6_IXOPE|nr:hypothetical protein HPB47_011690 [Ixodes persulcatus]